MKIYHIQYKPNLKLRTAATLIDYSIVILIIYIYIRCVGTESEIDIYKVEGWAAIPLPIFWFLYFPALETVNQATPGHDICGLKVVKTSGEKIGLSSAVKRRLLDFIDFGLYCIPALICINKKAKHQRLGDMFADTVIVKKTDIIEEEVSFR